MRWSTLEDHVSRLERCPDVEGRTSRSTSEIAGLSNAINASMRSWGDPNEEMMLKSREEDALKMNENSSITLLQLIQEVAYCDGSMSQEEENLIITLMDSHGLKEDRDALKNRLIEGYSSPSSHQSVARGSTKRIERDELLSRLRALTSKEERDLAIKLSYLTAMVSRDQDDLTDVNAQELDLFQAVAEAVQCPEQRVRAIQWAADEELKQWTMPSLKQVLLSWLG